MAKKKQPKRCRCGCNCGRLIPKRGTARARAQCTWCYKEGHRR